MNLKIRTDSFRVSKMLIIAVVIALWHSSCTATEEDEIQVIKLIKNREVSVVDSTKTSLVKLLMVGFRDQGVRSVFPSGRNSVPGVEEFQKEIMIVIKKDKIGLLDLIEMAEGIGVIFEVESDDVGSVVVCRNALNVYVIGKHD